MVADRGRRWRWRPSPASALVTYPAFPSVRTAVSMSFSSLAEREPLAKAKRLFLGRVMLCPRATALSEMNRAAGISVYLCGFPAHMGAKFGLCQAHIGYDCGIVS